MNFNQVIILIVVIVVSIIAIRFTFKFDLNKHLENRRKIKLDQLKNICPHVRLIKDGEKFGIESFFVSPVGTMDYKCSQCGCVTGEEEVNRISERYAKNPDLIFKKQKKFIKKARRLKIV